MSKQIFIPDESAMLALGKRLADESKVGDIIYLIGDLGAGKTTLTRGFLRAFGIEEPVKSPTFTLIETYHANETLIYHFDFYRLNDPKELNQIGLNDYFTEDVICLIEWPEKAENYLPESTRYCKIEIPDKGEGRWVTIG